MKVLASPAAVAFIRERGGSLFVWADRALCCTGELTFLEASTESPGADRSFRCLTSNAFDLLFDPGGKEFPDELHLDVKGWRRKRVRAYWNGKSFSPA
jgi:hypothetical protein